MLNGWLLRGWLRRASQALSANRCRISPPPSAWRSGRGVYSGKVRPSNFATSANRRLTEGGIDMLIGPRNACDASRTKGTASSRVSFASLIIADELEEALLFRR